MKFIELIKLKYRANKYKFKNDKGGISYILSTVKCNQTVLDIGAHKAGYLYFMLKRVGNGGKVYAFEPQLNLYEYIKRLKNIFKWNNVTVEHLALSDVKSKAILYIPLKGASIRTSPSATILETKENESLKYKEEVFTETLDNYCNNNNIKPDFLKIDVEGNELKIFKGGVNTINKYKPKILVEIEVRHIGRDQVMETFKYLNDLGYMGYFICGISKIPISDFSFDKYQNINDMKNYCNNFIFE